MDSSIKTLGISPKVIAASVTAYAAPIIVGYIAKQVGIDIDVDTATALLLPLVTAAVTFGASYAAKAGLVHVDMDQGLYYPDPYTGPNPPAKVPTAETESTVPEASAGPSPENVAAARRSLASKKAAATRKRNKAKR